MPRRVAPASGRAAPRAAGPPVLAGLPAPRAHFHVTAMRVAVLRSVRRRTGRRAARGLQARPVALKVSVRRVGLKASAVNGRRVGLRASAVNARRVGSKANVVNVRRAVLKGSVANARPAASRASAANGHRVVQMASVVSVPRAGWKAIGHLPAVTQNVTAASGRLAFRAMRARAALHLAAHAAATTPAVRALRAQAALPIPVLVASALRGANATIRASGARRSGHALVPTAAPARNAAPSIGPRATTARAVPRPVHATSARARRKAVRSSVASARSPNRSRVATVTAPSAHRGKTAMPAPRLAESLAIGRRAVTAPLPRVRPVAAIAPLAAALPSATALAKRRAAPPPSPDRLAPRKRRRVRPHPAAIMTMHRARCACRS